MYYVLQIEPSTGIALAHDGKRASGDEHWYPFDTREAAEAFCIERLRERPETGWALFGEDRTKGLHTFVDDAYWANLPDPPKRPASLWQRLRARFRR
jgi:hypothetical protein